ncbi:MAG: hypothetical protein H0V97_02990 [Actinobacteria bacterium]|nr:hypothetical protein [Actinomycetota bacterium]
MTGRPNRVLSVMGDRVIVGTEKSPEGKPIQIEWVQAATEAQAALAMTGVVSTQGHNSPVDGLPAADDTPSLASPLR